MRNATYSSELSQMATQKYFVESHGRKQFLTMVLPLIQGVDLRQYSRQIEQDLLKVENASIEDCICQHCRLGDIHVHDVV